MLNSKQITFLRSESHAMNPVVQIGLKGLTESVLKEIDINLNAHELIKIKVQNNDKIERQDTMAAICEKLGAEPINHIGNLIVIFRANTKTKISIP
jgi:RNA-binding protein